MCLRISNSNVVMSMATCYVGEKSAFGIRPEFKSQLELLLNNHCNDP